MNTFTVQMSWLILDVEKPNTIYEPMDFTPIVPNTHSITDPLTRPRLVMIFALVPIEIVRSMFEQLIKFTVRGPHTV